MKNSEKNEIFEKMDKKERIVLKEIERESVEQIVQRANSSKSEEKLEKQDQFF